MKNNYKLKIDGGLIKDAEPLDIITRYERIPTTILGTALEGARYIAAEIADAIRTNQQKKKKFLMAISSGTSPIGVYRQLVDMHNNGDLSFSNVVVFSVFEYYPMDPSDSQSYSNIIYEEFISHVDIKEENIYLLDGGVPLDMVTAYCRHYEEIIEEQGGLDLILLGVGAKGQIALSESGTHPNSVTRLVELSLTTRKQWANVFYGIENVPERGLTMGISTIMEARRVVALGWGDMKAEAFAKIIEGDINSDIPASYLQAHKDVEIVIDEDAASQLTRVKTPWLVGTCYWTDKFIRKALLWLCDKVKKPILKLTYEDYLDNYLQQLVTATGETYDKINIKVFNDLQHTISGWPGGKPNSDDSTRPERSFPYPKRVVIFSPHPDDDVISMGGTFLRLVEQGHDVHVAYQTSGNIAVHDDVVIQMIDTGRELGLGDKYEFARQLIEEKKVSHSAQPCQLLELKGAIRRAEAKAACRQFGLNDETHVHFLNLPFYETGSVTKSGRSQKDIDIVIGLLRQVKPHQVYAAGDLADPHGTHRISIEIVLDAMYQIKNAGDEWINDCRIWLYRGAWLEWDLDMVDMAVPLSPDEVIQKRHAIFRHLSQKDIVPFPGEDKREFWQRSEERTQATAQLYDKLGMAEYQAIETFVRYDLD